MTYSPNCSTRRETVQFLVVHWSGGSYRSARDWCLRDESDVSYHLLIGRAPGEICQLVHWDYAAWAVGVSASHDPRVQFRSGNHASENIALSGGPPTPPSPWQLEQLELVLIERMRAHGWGPADTWRIVDHRALAMPRGRKPDVTMGGWLDLEQCRKNVSEKLQEAAS